MFSSISLKSLPWGNILYDAMITMNVRFYLMKFVFNEFLSGVEYNSRQCGGAMNAPVLVLNTNFEPINVCTTRRAVGLILLGKADLVMNGRGYLQTVRQTIPIPSVIRLERMIRRPRLQVKLTRREVFRRDKYTCQYCRRRSSDLTVDHVWPKHLGGAHTWTNVVAACPSCNHRKGGQQLEDAQMVLLQTPKEPPASAYYIFGRHLEENSEWEQFIHGW